MITNARVLTAVAILCGFIATVAGMALQTTQPSARPFLYWTSSTPYSGPAMDAGLFGVTTAPPPSQVKRAAGYTNLWQCRNDSTWNGQANLERLKRDTCIHAAVAVHTSTVEPYRGRLLLDCSQASVQTWIRHEAQRLTSAGYDLIFLDNFDFGCGPEWVPNGARPSNEWVQSNIKAALATFLDERAKLAPQRPVMLIANVSKYWQPWIADPAGFLLDNGVRGLMLESLNTRKVSGDGAYAVGMTAAKKMLASGGEVWLLHKKKGDPASDQAAKEIDAELGSLGIVYTASE